MKELLLLYSIFAKIGAVTFGGGYAMLPILRREIVEKYGWATDEELLDYFAIGQCTPGIIAVNTATFIGYKRRKISGAIFATLGLITPSIIIIGIIAACLRAFAEYPAVQSAFAGIRVCVCVLIADAVIKLFKKAVPDKITLAFYLAVLSLSVFANFGNVLIVVISALVGIIYGKVRKGDKSDAS